MSRVYFIKGADAIKIGFSADVGARMRALRIGSPVDLVLIGSVEAPVSFERAMHHKLAEHRVQGEWFADVPAVRSVIDAVLAHGVAAIGFIEPKARADYASPDIDLPPDIWGQSAREAWLVFNQYEYVIARAPAITAAEMIAALRGALDDIEELMDAGGPPTAAVDRVRQLATELAAFAHRAGD